MPSFDFSILLVDKKTFWFSKGPARIHCARVCGRARPNRLSFSESSRFCRWRRGLGRLPESCWQRTLEFSPVTDMLAGDAGQSSFSFHFPKWSWSQLQSGSSGQGIRQSEEHPLPSSPGSLSSNTHPIMLLQSGSLGTHIFISVRRCSPWKLPLICSFIMNWKDKYWKIAAGASRESPGVKVSLGTCPDLSQHQIFFLEKREWEKQQFPF